MATTQYLLSGSTLHLIRTNPLAQSSLLQWRNTTTTPPSFNPNFTPLRSSHSINPFKLSLKCTAKPTLNPISEPDTRPQDPITVDDLMDTVWNVVKKLEKNTKSESGIQPEEPETTPVDEADNESEADYESDDPNPNRVDDIKDTILNVVQGLKKQAIALVLKGVVMICNPYTYRTSSGGRMGGSRTGTEMGSIVALLMLVDKAYQMSSGESICSGMNKTTVVKLQVGLMGSTRSLQKELNWIAETAKTSTLEGLSYVLTESTVALLRLEDACISAHSFVDVDMTLDKGEKLLNKFSIEERAKFNEETLVNVNNMQRKRRTSLQADASDNDYIVVTILVAAEGDHELPTINEIKDLKHALQKLGSIPCSQIAGVEVIWTPQDERDALLEEELVEDYPQLKPLETSNA